MSAKRKKPSKRRGRMRRNSVKPLRLPANVRLATNSPEDQKIATPGWGTEHGIIIADVHPVDPERVKQLKDHLASANAPDPNKTIHGGIRRKKDTNLEETEINKPPTSVRLRGWGGVGEIIIRK